MKSIQIVSALLIALCAGGPALAGTQQLAEEKQCFQCHSVDKDTIGPSFHKIKAIYGSMKDPEARLVEVIQMGSEAHLGPLWGQARMPDMSERPEISDAEAKQLARWILQ